MFTPFNFDRPRQIRFDIQACSDLETALGAPFGEICHRIDLIGVNAICAALWAGMKHDDPTLNIAGVRKRLQAFIDNGGSMSEVVNTLNAAILNSTPLKKNDEVPEGNGAPGPAVSG